MTEEVYNKATALLEQIEKLKNLNKRLQKDYSFHKQSEDKHLLETLEKCGEVVDVLLEIDRNKFEKL